MFQQQPFFRTPLFPDSRNFQAKENELCMEKDFFFPLIQNAFQNELFRKTIASPPPCFLEVFQRVQSILKFFCFNLFDYVRIIFLEISSFFRECFQNQNIGQPSHRVHFDVERRKKPIHCGGQVPHEQREQKLQGLHHIVGKSLRQTLQKLKLVLLIDHNSTFHVRVKT